jgi:hypothetical protein
MGGKGKGGRGEVVVSPEESVASLFVLKAGHRFISD